jgi:hypothetical protein
MNKRAEEDSSGDENNSEGMGDINLDDDDM